MKLQALTAVVALAFCSLQALCYPVLHEETRDLSNGTNTTAGTYTVVAGDTLDGIAAAEGITTQQLEDANPGVAPTDLQIGEVLNLPTTANSTSNSLNPQVSARQILPRRNTYTVVSGDTLDAIAAAEGVSTEQLEDANPGVVPANLQVGEVLNLPSAASATVASSAPTSILLPSSASSTVPSVWNRSMAMEAPAADSLSVARARDGDWSRAYSAVRPC